MEQRFPKLLGAEAERSAVRAKRLAKEGAFDPQVSIETDTLRYNSALTRGKAGVGLGNTLAIEVATPSGLKLGAGRNWNAGSVKSPNSATGSAGTYYLYAGLPLARNAGINPKAAALSQARLAEPAAAAALASTRQAALVDAASAYYEWAGAVQRLQISQTLLDAGLFRAQGLKKELDRGLQAAVTVTEAEAEVERRRAGVVKAQREVDKAAFKLAKFAWDGTDLQKHTPTQLEEPVPLDSVPVEDRIQHAHRRRPELELLRLQLASVRMDGRLAQNDLKPAVDLVVSPGADLGSKGIGESYKIGVTASVPLYQRDARGRRDEAYQKAAKLEQERALLERTIALEVQDAANAIQRAIERYRRARERFEKTKKVEEGEVKLFQAGLGTLFLVNQREQATAEAASLLVEIQVEYALAQAALRAAIMEF